jgi:YVTN family beta-propeller protein
MKKKWILACFAASIAFVSCKKDELPPVPPDASSGTYIVNEGRFLSNTASLTHIALDGQVTPDIYYLANEAEMGDVLQCFIVVGRQGFAVLNNSQKIEVVEISTMRNRGTISGLSYPRYATGTGSDKLYVTNGSGQGTVEVYNTETLEAVSSIPVGAGPNQLLYHNNELWVCNEGGFGLDSTLTVINAATNSVVDVITLAHRPMDLVTDAGGDVWVLCSGETFYDLNWSVSGHSRAMLYRIDASTHEVVSSMAVGQLGDHPRQLEVSPDGRILYYENNGVFALDAQNAIMPGQSLIQSSRAALSVNPSTGEIWCASQSDYVNPSTVFVYRADGTLIRSYEGGIATNAIEFN